MDFALPAAKQRAKRRENLLLNIERPFAGLDDDIRRIEHGVERGITLALHGRPQALDLTDQRAREFGIEPILLLEGLRKLCDGNDKRRISNLFGRPQQCARAYQYNQNRNVMLEEVERRVAFRNEEPLHQTAKCAHTRPKLRTEPPDWRKPQRGTQIERRRVRTLSRPCGRGGHRRHDSGCGRYPGATPYFDRSIASLSAAPEQSS